MNTIRVEIEALDNGNYQPVERERDQNGTLVRELRLAECATKERAEALANSDEKNFYKFRRS